MIEYTRPDKKPAEGDMKKVGDRVYQRRQVYSYEDKAYIVSRGRPVYEWYLIKIGAVTI